MKIKNNGKEKLIVDTTFNVYTDSNGGDPDSKFPTL
jgi:hypothetical protein